MKQLGQLVLLIAITTIVQHAVTAIQKCDSHCPVYIQAPEPVCGDGKQFYDECRAKCAGAKIITKGPCRCVCTKNYSPVCSNGVNYSNMCMARCAGATVITQGRCCEPCHVRCSNDYKPVCANGVTYRNKCQTFCLCPKPKRVVRGKCRRLKRIQKPVCACPKIYRPVCAKGKTFGNSCEARCSGFKKYTNGSCCPRCFVKCARIYRPVCADGVTYANKCLTFCLCPKPKKVVRGKCRK